MQCLNVKELEEIIENKGRLTWLRNSFSMKHSTMTFKIITENIYVKNK